MTNHRPLGVPKHQPTTNSIGDGKQTQVLTQLAMITVWGGGSGVGVGENVCV